MTIEETNGAASEPPIDCRVMPLPCPFCGSTPEIRSKGNDYTTKRSVTIRCPGCRVERTDAALRYGMAWLERTAIENWNKRHNASGKPTTEAAKPL